MKVLKLLHPPLMTNTPHRISSTFQAKTTWGGNILLGQDCLLKIWTNMTWNFPMTSYCNWIFFCGSKSSSSSSQFWNDLAAPFFILLALQAKIDLKCIYLALEFNVCLTLAWIFPFTPSSIFIKLSRLLNKIGSLLQVYFMNF